jgi:hypothetical protein
MEVPERSDSMKALIVATIPVPEPGDQNAREWAKHQANMDAGNQINERQADGREYACNTTFTGWDKPSPEARHGAYGIVHIHTLKNYKMAEKGDFVHPNDMPKIPEEMDIFECVRESESVLISAIAIHEQTAPAPERMAFTRRMWAGKANDEMIMRYIWERIA